MNSIANDTLLEIFSYLSLSSLYDCARVCKNWRRQVKKVNQCNGGHLESLVYKSNLSWIGLKSLTLTVDRHYSLRFVNLPRTLESINIEYISSYGRNNVNTPLIFCTYHFFRTFFPSMRYIRIGYDKFFFIYDNSGSSVIVKTNTNPCSAINNLFLCVPDVLIVNNVIPCLEDLPYREIPFSGLERRREGNYVSGMYIPTDSTIGAANDINQVDESFSIHGKSTIRYEGYMGFDLSTICCKSLFLYYKKDQVNMICINRIVQSLREQLRYIQIESHHSNIIRIIIDSKFDFDSSKGDIETDIPNGKNSLRLVIRWVKVPYYAE